MAHHEDSTIPKVQKWLSRLRKHQCTVHSLETLYAIRKRDTSVLFTLLKAEASDPEGRALPPYIFVRGDACLIVPLLINSTTGEKKFCMIRQRRIAHGAMALEFPAGMLDERVDSPLTVAVHELEEETGLVVPAADLTPLSPAPLFSSPGGSDEAIHYFGCIVSLDAEAFESFEGRMRGSAAEHERTHVTLKTWVEAERETSSLQCLLGMYLFEKHFGPIAGVRE